MNANKRQQKLDESRRACQAGDTAGAERICHVLLRANKADVQALHLLGVIAAWRADDAAAVAHLSRCVAIDPRNAQFHSDLARVHALAGRHEPALAGLQRATELRPDNPRMLTDLADVLERSAQHARAWRLGSWRLSGKLDAGQHHAQRLGAPTDGRVAFRYFVTAAGPSDANSNIIGVDQFSYLAAAVPEPASWALSLASLAGVATLVRARRNRAA